MKYLLRCGSLFALDEIRRERSCGPAADESNLLALASLALLAGAGSGLIAAIFRLTLEHADHWRDMLIDRAHHQPLIGCALVVAGSAAAVALAAWLVRRFSPQASGSGIPQVEAALSGDLPPAPPWIVLVKFVGGVLTIGAGMALGREGPSVQMSAVVAHMVGKRFHRSWPDIRTLLAAGAGAGLAVAFNAPIAGAVFVLEELVRRFETRIAIAALGASSTAILISRLFLGDAPDFHVTVSTQAAIATGPLPYVAAAAWPLYVALGIAAGVAAGLYNRAVLGAMSLAVRLDDHCPVEVQGAAIGALIRRHGVSRSLLWNWRHEARKRGMVAERAFVPVRVAEEATTLRAPTAMEQCAGSASAAAQLDGTTAGSPTGTIDIELGGARLRISGAVDTAILRQVLTYLGRKP
jgi:CIC family chloride channel protein